MASQAVQVWRKYRRDMGYLFVRALALACCFSSKAVRDGRERKESNEIDTQSLATRPGRGF